MKFINFNSNFNFNFNSKFIFISIIFFIFSFFFNQGLISQEHKSISPEEIQLKIQELKNSSLPDSVLYSTIGYFRKEKVRFSQLIENKLYVGDKGIYYRMDFADDFGNTTISCTFFSPHIRFVPLPAESQDKDYAPLMNEHICRCKASFGYAVIQKEGKSFTCTDTVPSTSEIENYTINCVDLQSLDSFYEKYFNFGYSIQSKIKIVAKREILLLE